MAFTKVTIQCLNRRLRSIRKKILLFGYIEKWNPLILNKLRLHTRQYSAPFLFLFFSIPVSIYVSGHFALFFIFIHIDFCYGEKCKMRTCRSVDFFGVSRKGPRRRSAKLKIFTSNTNEPQSAKIHFEYIIYYRADGSNPIFRILEKRVARAPDPENFAIHPCLVDTFRDKSTVLDVLQKIFVTLLSSLLCCTSLVKIPAIRA